MLVTPLLRYSAGSNALASRLGAMERVAEVSAQLSPRSRTPPSTSQINHMPARCGASPLLLVGLVGVMH